jgi:hypothetical protein
MIMIVCLHIEKETHSFISKVIEVNVHSENNTNFRFLAAKALEIVSCEVKCAFTTPKTAAEEASIIRIVSKKDSIRRKVIQVNVHYRLSINNFRFLQTHFKHTGDCEQ